MESPRTIDKYELVEKLGEGGFGVVYKARHLVTKLPVAIKILVTRTDAHPDVATRFRREASIGNEIDHENIVRALDFGYVAGQPYLVLEFLDGMGVDEAVRTRGPLAPHRVARIALQVADALAAAHGHGVIHRDLKPENIFLVRRGGRDDFVKVLDFGIAKLTSGASQDGLATRSQTLIGSPVTMSPEQCRGADIDSRSDVYALGVVIFFALTGRYPFFGPQADILSMHLRDRPPRLDSVRPGVPPSLVALVDRALAKDPAARFQTMGELARALAPLVADPALAATPQERPTVLTPGGRATRSLWPALVAVAAAGAAVALAGGGVWRMARAPQAPPAAAMDETAAVAAARPATSGEMTSETRAGTDEARTTSATMSARTTSAPAAGRGDTATAAGRGDTAAGRGDTATPAAHGGSAQVAAHGDSAQVAAHGGSAQVAAHGASAQVAAHGASAQVAAHGDASQVAAHGDSATLAAHGDSATVTAHGARATVTAHAEGAQVAAHGDGAQALALGDRATLAAHGEGAQVLAHGDRATVAAHGGATVAIRNDRAAAQDGKVTLAAHDDAASAAAHDGKAAVAAREPGASANGTGSARVDSPDATPARARTANAPALEPASGGKAQANATAGRDESAADARNGYLTVAVLPFAEVMVDGHVAGTTPLRNLPLRPGAHSVEISNVGLHRHTRRNQRIDAGAHQRIQLDWSN